MALWTPADITTALWLDAADSSTLFDAASGGSAVSADGAVARWEDKSGNARHATQTTLAHRPLRRTVVQNSLDVLQFDGGNDFLTTSSTHAAGAIFVVYNKTTAVWSTFNGVITARTAPNSNKAPASNENLGFAGIGGLATNITGLNSTSVFVNGSSANNANFLNFNIGVPTASATGFQMVSQLLSTSVSGAKNLVIGADVFSSVGSRQLAGNVAEIIILDSQPSVDVRTRTEGYLAHKWGLTANLPSDHPYKTVAPTTGTIQTRRRRQLGGYGL